MLYLNYSENRTGGEVCSGEENDDWPSYEDEFIEFHPLSLHVKRPKDWLIYQIKLDWKPNIGDYVYLVIARYFDGGTFARTCGYWKIVGTTKTIEEANSLKESIYNEKVSYNTDDEDYIYRPWIGYFAGLEHIEIHPMKVEL